MSQCLWIGCLLLFMSSLLQALEFEVREWRSTAGTTLSASFVKLTGDDVFLLREGRRKPMKVKLSQLSSEDQAHVEELLELIEKESRGGTEISGIDAMPGQISGQIKCANDEQWSYHVYLPTSFHTGKKWPVWFVMSPGGGVNGGPINRYISGAERLECIVVASVESKNGFKLSHRATSAMVQDVYDRFPVSESLGFTSGMSGGSRMAYITAESEAQIAGVLACGSGRGVYLEDNTFRSAKLRRSTYVYSLIGTNCFNRSEAARSHIAFPKDFRLRYFPGKHVWAKTPYLDEGMARVYGEALKNSKDSTLDAHRQRYGKTMRKWMLELKEEQPWEAYEWVKFLSEFPASARVKDDAKSLVSELKDDPRVTRAAEADKTIWRFINKHFSEYISSAEAKKTNPVLEAEAKKLSEEFSGLPHAELLLKLGEKCY